ncbi:MAG: RNA-directed DNA polymerase [Alteromonas macleodii]|uniref:RNA-directed DNA polymerase n=1 Tax=Alteromonas TaxID=226 RepID=UPI00128A2542|nr:RNA-directed DNA polymerase [Alteromonas macleodii]MDM7964001.1 RNA-directed DNA polymerase [Alteromonas macleodii]MDM8172462.1 RNA-directed DNA polymerase [Alteromonas macleodii]CAI3964706.1 reverse transcriptase (RNA-dependent DNA polymerase) [Alteromonas macleodii]VTP56899.1 reverse transcriptase (RNA-dependent DNA polymerase) [Alteromonas macleodii]
MDENLLAFPINYRATLKHLRQDLKDDWFFDTVRYEDLLSNTRNLHEILSKNLEENHGEYKSGHRTMYDVPKRSLGLRYSLETDFYDRFLYQAICTYLIPYFDPILSHRVFSHRYNKHGKEKYLFKHRIELWNTFENISYIALEDDKTLLITDLLNYFEQISIESIECAFIGMMSAIDASGAEKNNIRSAINTLKVLLQKWCYNERHGLPQNRDASSFIANVVLDAVDKRMVDKGYDYFRYVDDIRIICSDEFEAKRALNDLIFELRKLGLNINSKKTEILNNSSKNIDEFFPSSDETMILIDTMWRSKSKKVIARSIPILFEFLQKQIRSGETQSRPFRYCINRFKTLISSNIFDSKSILAGEIADALIEELPHQAVSSDQFSKLLMDLDLSAVQCENIVDFIKNKDIAIHGWQNYHLIMLLAYKKFKSSALVEHCKKLVILDIKSPESPACFIYLASVGLEQEVESFIPLFNESWPYQHQRCFLIALQESDPKKLSPMFGKVGYRTKGTVKRMKQNKHFSGKTIYLRDFNTTVITEVYNELSPYE